MKRACILILFISLVCCHTPDTIPFRQLDVVDSVSSFPDSSFFSDLRQLQCVGDNFYALDVDRRQVIALDSSFKKMAVYGLGGRGPGELLMPYSFFASSDTVFILDFADQTVKSYSRDGYVGQRKVTGCQLSDERFFVEDTLMFLPIKSESALFVRLSPHTSQAMGDPASFPSMRKTITMNRAGILPYKDKVVVVPGSLPYVQVYGRDGHLYAQIDLSVVDFFQENVDEVLGRSKNAPDNASFVLNADAVVSGEKLYLLCPRFLPSYRVDRILVIDLEAYSVEEVLCLPDAVYNSIAVHEGALYAYNYQGSLDKLN